MTMEQAQSTAKKMLSAKRYRHTKNVAKAARGLALRWGENPDKAELAGWLHDIVKEKPPAELLQLMEQDGIIAGSTKSRPKPIWHGPCGAVYAKHHLGVQDGDILSAIACHTTGRVGMTRFDKVLFLADMISEEREFDGVGHIRALAQADIDDAVIAAMEENIRYLNRAGKTLDRDTEEALRALKAQCKNRLEAKI